MKINHIENIHEQTGRISRCYDPEIECPARIPLIWTLVILYLGLAGCWQTGWWLKYLIVRIFH